VARGLKGIFKYRMEKFFYEIKKCRICSSSDLDKILDLGITPLANAFLRKEDLEKPEPKFPLELYFCNNCSLVQLGHVVRGDLLFKNYHYVTSASKPLVEHFNSFADEIADQYVQSPDDLVIEIGSNDGTLLARIKDRCRVLGIDPAENVAELAEKNGVQTIINFFSSSLAEEIKKKYGLAKVIVANNVMAHIEGIRDVFLGVKNLLADGGKFIFEVHWVGNLIGEGGFDQIYHEHLYYYSLHSLKALTDSLGLVINDVKLIPIHGESLRVFVGKEGAVSGAVKELFSREQSMGLDKLVTFKQFSNKVEENKKHLRDLLFKVKSSGKRIVGYGAPAKGNTLLNYFQIGPDILDFVTDSTPLKQGAYTPGMRVPVVHPDVLKTNPPDYILLLAWNYADAILEKEKDLRAKGVKFIIPVPEVRVV
jgi:SAM-dependent methyltransferase